jgi:hypothetical protein
MLKAFEQPRTTSFCNHPADESYITNALGFVHAKKAHGGGEARPHSFLKFDLEEDELPITCPKGRVPCTH